MVAVSSEDIRARMGLVRGVAGRLRARYGNLIDGDDIRSVCMVALWQALGKGIVKPSHLCVRMRGAVLDEIRRADCRSSYSRKRDRELGVQTVTTHVPVIEYVYAPRGGLPQEKHAVFRNPPDMISRIDLRNAVSRLRPTNRRIVRYLAAGLSQDAAGKKLGVTATRVCQRVREIREAVGG